MENAQDMINTQNQQYADFDKNKAGYLSNQNNQALDEGNQEYNQQKEAIDKNANARGLLYSGLKQGAESGAANDAANKTQNKIATNNMNMNNYATGYGNQVAQSNIANYQGNVQSALNQYGYGLAQQNQQNEMYGSAAGGAGKMAATFGSDKKLKEGISDADDDVEEMMSKLDAKKYNYKDDPEKKEHMGILAQDLEKSPMGKALVIETPKGKAVDIAKALGAMMAVQSTIHKRLKRAGA